MPEVPVAVPGLETVISGSTVTGTLLVALHPLNIVTDRLYVVDVVTEDAVVGLVVVPERKVAGDHK